jgi:hypothetical protein
MRFAVIAAALAAVALALPTAARTDTGIVATCNGGPCSTGWYRVNVHVSFILPAGSSNPQGCGDVDVTQDTPGTPFMCTVTVSGSQCCVLSFTIKRDATPPTVDAVTPARGPDSNGWYNHAFGYSASGTDATPGSGIASCTSTTYSGPDSGSASVSATCTDVAGNVSAPKSISFEYDATPPSVTASPARGADANGWYDHAVAVSFSGSDSVSGVAGCTSATYSGPDSGSASVSGTCTDKAGNTGSASFGLKYDATPPTVTGETPDRAPDANGYYNHKLTVTFAGSDATSGIASCDTPSYDKPNDATASVAGRCTDNAGNQSAPATFSFKYDSSPPKLSGLQVTSLDKAATLSWQASTDVTKVTVMRTGGGKPDTVYSGKRVTTVTDKKVRNGDRYTYLVTAYDEAGNSAALKGLATPSAPLLAPRAAAHIRGGVTLRWRAVRGASYYNVQLWLKGRKVLTTWPAGPTLHLDRLAPGTYTWIVWPGRGARSSHRYGPKIGTSTFVVTG